MRNLKKAVAVFLTAAMTMSASIMAFADTKVTFHFQNSQNWEEVGGYIYEGISWTTNVTDDTYVTCNKADGTVKKLWPGAKCKSEGSGWYSCTATFSDDVVTNGMVFKFNNFVGDASLNDTTEQDDLDAIAASGIKTTATAEKKETDGIIINKKTIANTFGGSVPSDIYVEYDGKVATFSATAPASYPAASTSVTDNNNTSTDNNTTSTDNNSSAGTSTNTNTNTSTNSGSTTSAPKTGDAVSVSVVMISLLAVVAFVASKKRVNG